MSHWTDGMVGDLEDAARAVIASTVEWRTPVGFIKWLENADETEPLLWEGDNG